MVVWIVELPEHHYPGWSIGLTVFACALCITAAILLIPDIREYDYKDLLKVKSIISLFFISSELHRHFSATAFWRLLRKISNVHIVLLVL